jgi:hypothetical protein
MHSGSTGCHNYFLILNFFALYVSSHLGRMVYNQKSGLEPKWGKLVQSEIVQFFLMF